jgi:hypothetical protein
MVLHCKWVLLAVVEVVVVPCVREDLTKIIIILFIYRVLMLNNIYS